MNEDRLRRRAAKHGLLLRKDRADLNAVVAGERYDMALRDCRRLAEQAGGGLVIWDRPMPHLGRRWRRIPAAGVRLAIDASDANISARCDTARAGLGL